MYICISTSLSLYIYIYIYIHIYRYAHKRGRGISLSLYIYIYIYMSISLSIYIYIYRERETDSIHMICRSPSLLDPGVRRVGPAHARLRRGAQRPGALPAERALGGRSLPFSWGRGKAELSPFSQVLQIDVPAKFR